MSGNVGTLPDNIVEHNGLYVDRDTGEIVGVATANESGGGFRVRDRASAEWVLERIFEAESEYDALKRRLDTYARNIFDMQAEHARRAKWLRKRFGDELEAWARAELEGQKQRTVRTPFGRLSFRKRKARVVVTDEDAVLAWAKVNESNAVKVIEKFLVSEVRADRLRVWLTGGPVPPGFAIEPEHDTFKIDTGVE